ncbi:MAG: V-type ATP synthase subunit E [Chlamydiales bacterium]|nr:V-type ATP synthase subunit E [Chlamydiales bacterium]
MKGIESGKEKVKKICDALRKETLEPALLEAEEIVLRAREEAEKIIAHAKKQASLLLDEGKEKLVREQATFQSALNQASKQTLQFLRQTIEEKLFNRELSHQLSKPLQNPQVLANLISAVIKAIEKEGKETDLSAFIASSIPAKEVNALLAKEILERLKEKSVLISQIGGGVEVKLKKENITLDLSDTALYELIAGYIRKDFRETFFEGVSGHKK